MRFVVSYDISNDKRRRKVATTMEGYGYRVQYSVFECSLSKKQFQKLKRELQPYVKASEMDSIRFYPLPADVVKTIHVMGNDMALTLGVIAVV